MRFEKMMYIHIFWVSNAKKNQSYKVGKFAKFYLVITKKGPSH